MCEESSKSNYWQDLLTDVANDLDLMLDDLCQDLELASACENGTSSEFSDSMPRTESLHEQSLQRVGSFGTGSSFRGSDPSDLCSKLPRDYKKGHPHFPSQSSESQSQSFQHLPQTVSGSGWGDSDSEFDQTQSDGRSSALSSANGASGKGGEGLASSFSASALPTSLGAGCLGQQSSVGTLTSAISLSSGSSGSNFVVEIGILERLICTHSIWFLPDILRGGTVHLLQNKEIGNFIIRKSSKPETLALTVRLPPNVGPHIEHYLIEKNETGEFHLEGSDSLFSSVPLLVTHYCQCCDELPVQLTLPSILNQAATRQELLSISLLGQDFWSSPSMFLSLEHMSESSLRRHTAPSSAAPLHKPPLPAPISPSTQESLLPLLSSDSESNSSHQNLPHKTSLSSANTFNGAPPPIPTAPKPPLRVALAPPVSVPTPTSGSISTGIKEENSKTNSFDTQENPSSVDSLMRSKINGSSSIVSKFKSSIVSLNQSETIESPGLYYHSSLADKVSDYEDIWGNSSTASEKEQTKAFVTFKPQRPLSSILEKTNAVPENLENQSLINPSNQQLLNSVKKENVYIQAQLDPKEMVSNWTQTDEAANASQHRQLDNSEFNPRRDFKATKQSSLSVQDIRTHNLNYESLARLQQNNMSSPFYSEPIDSVVSNFDFEHKNLPKEHSMSKRLVCHRHSDPNILGYNSPLGNNKSTKTEQKQTTDSLSSSLEHLSSEERRARAKDGDTDAAAANHLATKPPISRKCSKKLIVDDSQEFAAAACKKSNVGPKKEMTWEVDSSWEWMGKDEQNSFIDDSPLYSFDLKFPLNFNKSRADGSQVSDTTTVEDLINSQSPEFCLSEESPSSSVVGASEYDNLEIGSIAGRGQHYLHGGDHIDDTATEFSEPWDSRRWERVLQLIPQGKGQGQAKGSEGVKDSVNGRNSSLFNNNETNRNELGDTTPLINYEDTDSASVVSSTSTNDDETSISEIPTVPIGRKESKRGQQRTMEPFIDTSRMATFRTTQDTDVGEAIRQYIFRLALEKNNTFAMAIENFIQCTKECNETNPSIIMRNIRQFMTGMKNYLLKHGEGQFEQLVQTERGKLKVDEFLNIDAIVEGTLHKLVIKPLKNFIYQLFVDAYKSNGSLQLLSDNIKQARDKSKEEMGIRPEFQPPEGPALEIVRHYLLRLQQEYSPVKKLENLLVAISTIYQCVQQKKTSQGQFHTSLGADDFLPIFIFVLVHCGMISAEIEADFMWGLLQPSMLSGEGGYYLTTLSSAVHVLKSLHSTLALPDDGTRKQGETVPNELEGDAKSGDVTVSSEPRLPSIADLQGFMKIMIPDELSGSIISKTLPVRPNMTTKDVCKMIALKFKITNPQDYVLFKLVKGDETQLGDNECPQSVKADLLATGIECLFAYKRSDANFIWPVLH